MLSAPSDAISLRLRLSAVGQKFDVLGPLRKPCDGSLRWTIESECDSRICKLFRQECPHCSLAGNRGVRDRKSWRLAIATFWCSQVPCFFFSFAASLCFGGRVWEVGVAWGASLPLSSPLEGRGLLPRDGGLSHCLGTGTC